MRSLFPTSDTYHGFESTMVTLRSLSHTKYVEPKSINIAKLLPVGGVRVKPSSLIPGSSEFESWRIQNSSHLITFTVCKWSTRQNCLRKCQKLPPASFGSAAPASR